AEVELVVVVDVAVGAEREELEIGAAQGDRPAAAVRAGGAGARGAGVAPLGRRGAAAVALVAPAEVDRAALGDGGERGGIDGGAGERAALVEPGGELTGRAGAGHAGAAGVGGRRADR